MNSLWSPRADPSNMAIDPGPVGKGLGKRLAMREGERAKVVERVGERVFGVGVLENCSLQIVGG